MTANMPVRFLARADGRLFWPGGEAACVFGRTGCTGADQKREGDGATPLGHWAFREVFWRPDRISAPRTLLASRPLRPDDGWCDDPGLPDQYNRPVTLPFQGSHERMWRDDNLYDLVVVLGYNDDPPASGLGSAIFLHLASKDWGPTAGCVATDAGSLLALLAQAAPGDGLLVARNAPGDA